MRRLTRRQFLGAATGAAMALGIEPGRLIDKALAASTSSGGSLSDIEHIVVLMQENRSFDHYFGTMKGVRGYLDPSTYSSYAGGPTSSVAASAAQSMVGKTFDGRNVSYKLASGETVLEPFELTDAPPERDGQTLNDITHNWGPQHSAWNNGSMDRFAIEHLANDPIARYQVNSTDGVPTPGSSSVPTGLATMGYYRAADHLQFYRALAGAFTLCDGYHCSVLGPTDPNRLMSVSGSLGAGSSDRGGPVLTTYVQNKYELFGTLDWPTMPELLTAAGVSWKVYQDPTSTALFNVLPYFKNFAQPQNAEQATNARLGLTPVYPAEFAADVAAGTLPQVSWIMTPAFGCEHPAVPTANGEWVVAQILQTLVSNPAVWERTVFLVIYDENGGFFDHVPPPTPGPTVTAVSQIPTGDQYDGEYITTASPTNAAGGAPSDWYGILGPVGLGFRTPAFVISPFSAGGHVVSDTFDHVSSLKLIEKVFLSPGDVSAGLHVSSWRYGAVGDMTSALPALSSPVNSVPALPPTSLTDPDVAEQDVVNSMSGTVDYGQAYPPPSANSNDYQSQD